jgi:hypothetical protein
MEKEAEAEGDNLPPLKLTLPAFRVPTEEQVTCKKSFSRVVPEAEEVLVPRLCVDAGVYLAGTTDIMLFSVSSSSQFSRAMAEVRLECTCALISMFWPHS